MIKIKTKNFPPEGYDAVMIFPFIFYKNELTENELKHENAHVSQYLICMIVGAIILGVKYMFWGSFLNWIFIPLPFLLFYILWGIGYIFRDYEKIFLERWADWKEKK